MNDTGSDFMRGAVEALLFVSEKPVPVDQLVAALPGLGVGEIRRYIQELKTEYEQKNRGMVILEIAGGYQMLSSPGYSETVRTFFKTRVKERLSKPALEAMAIIAYKQPVSRADVELIRGVNSDGVVLHLLNRGLIKIVGRKEVMGRPFLYGTTKEFLEYFGLKSLNDLPKLEDFTSLFAANVQKSGTANAESATAAVSGDSPAGTESNVPSGELSAAENTAALSTETGMVVPPSDTDVPLAQTDLFSPAAVLPTGTEETLMGKTETEVLSFSSGAALSGDAGASEVLDEEIKTARAE